MFALIETKGASHIAVYIPHEGADKTLPALAGMLENNATFINKGWREIKPVKPEMSIVLGDNIVVGDDIEMAVSVPESASVLDESFVKASPDVFVSYDKIIKSKDDEIARIRAELTFVKSENERMKSQIQQIADDGEPL